MPSTAGLLPDHPQRRRFLASPAGVAVERQAKRSRRHGESSAKPWISKNAKPSPAKSVEGSAATRGAVAAGGRRGHLTAKRTQNRLRRTSSSERGWGISPGSIAGRSRLIAAYRRRGIEPSTPTLVAESARGAGARVVPIRSSRRVLRTRAIATRPNFGAGLLGRAVMDELDHAPRLPAVDAVMQARSSTLPQRPGLTVSSA